MSSFRVVVLGAVVLLGFGCKPAAEPATTSPPAVKDARADADTAPTPFTAEEIRRASPVGRRIELRVEANGKPTVVRVMSFVRSDEAGAEVESLSLDETGHAMGEKETSHATWEELRAHASFPRAATTIGEETVTVPAGTFDCRVYRVTRGDRVMTFWFAKSLPGPPVRMTVSAAGSVVETRTLVRHLARLAPARIRGRGRIRRRGRGRDSGAGFGGGIRGRDSGSAEIVTLRRQMRLRAGEDPSGALVASTKETSDMKWRSTGTSLVALCALGILAPHEARALPADDVRAGGGLWLQDGWVEYEGNRYQGQALHASKTPGTLDLVLDARALGIEYDATLHLTGTVSGANVVWTFSQDVPAVDLGWGANLNHVAGTIVGTPTYLAGSSDPLCDGVRCPYDVRIDPAPGSSVVISGSNPLGIGTWSRTISTGSFRVFAGVPRPQVSALEVTSPPRALCASDAPRTYVARVTLASPAPSAGATVELRSTDDRVRAPTRLHLAAGQRSATLSFTIPGSYTGALALEAAAGGATAHALITVAPRIDCVDLSRFQWLVRRDLIGELPCPSCVASMSLGGSSALVRTTSGEDLVFQPKQGKLALKDLLGKPAASAALDELGDVVGHVLDGNTPVTFRIRRPFDGPEVVWAKGILPTTDVANGALLGAIGGLPGYLSPDGKPHPIKVPGTSGKLVDGNLLGVLIGDVATTAGPRAFTQVSGQTMVLGTLGGATRAVGVNEAGALVGVSTTTDKRTLPVRFDAKTGKVVALPLPKGFDRGDLVGQTDAGIAFGNATNAYGKRVAYVSVPGKGAADLNLYVPDLDADVAEVLTVTPGGDLVVRGYVDGEQTIFSLSLAKP